MCVYVYVLHVLLDAHVIFYCVSIMSQSSLIDISSAHPQLCAYMSNSEQNIFVLSLHICVSFCRVFWSWIIIPKYMHLLYFSITLQNGNFKLPTQLYKATALSPHSQLSIIDLLNCQLFIFSAVCFSTSESHLSIFFFFAYSVSVFQHA